MGSLLIIDNASTGQGRLQVCRVAPLGLAQNFPGQGGGMKPLVFAQGLRMIGAAMRERPHAHPPQPHGQGGILMRGITPPRTAIVYQPPIG